MNDLQIFNNAEFGEVRTVVKDNEPWFVAADVCRALEIVNPTQAAARLDEDERSMFNIGRQGEAVIINEAGLYTLVLGSRKPEAKAFKRWITHEVIPSIRKHGAYMTPEAVREAIVTPENMIKILTALKDEQDKRKGIEADYMKLTDTVDELDRQVMRLTAERNDMEARYREYRIKSYFTDFCIDNGEELCIRDTAKELGVKETDFTKLLVDKKYLYRKPSNNRLFPYSTPKCRGMFVVKEVSYSGGLTYQTQTLITTAGRAKLTAECIKAGLIPALPEPDGVLWEV